MASSKQWEIREALGALWVPPISPSIPTHWLVEPGAQDMDPRDSPKEGSRLTKITTTSDRTRREGHHTPSKKLVMSVLYCFKVGGTKPTQV